MKKRRRRRPHILVLEAPWSPANLYDSTSVRGFISAWAEESGVRVAFRHYNDRRDLVHWLSMFLKGRGGPSIVYVAGHGAGKMMQHVHGDSSLRSILKRVATMVGLAASRRRRKGLLLGCCEVGADLGDLMEAGRGRFAWIAGYSQEVPWLEATIADIVFLDYMTRGRLVPAKRGFLAEIRHLRVHQTCRASTVAQWVREDYRVATMLGLGAVDARPRTRLRRTAASRRRKRSRGRPVVRGRAGPPT